MRKSLLLTASLMLTTLGAVHGQAQTAPTLAVRVGAHDNYDRVVFDWPSSVKYQFRREGAQATIVFESPGNIKFPPRLASDLTRASGFMAHNDGNKITVTFSLNPDASVRTFTNDNSVVIDIQGKPVATATPPAISNPPPVEPSPPAPPVLAQAPQVQDQTPPAPRPDMPVPLVSAKTPIRWGTKPSAPPAKEASAPPVPAPAPTEEKPQPKTPPSVAPAPKAAAKIPVQREPIAPLPLPKAEEAASAPPFKPSVLDTPAPVTAPQALPMPQAPAPEVPSASPPTPSPAATIPATRPKKIDPNLVVSDVPVLVAALDARVPTRAAIFERAGVGYIVFDRKLTLSPEALENGVPTKVMLEAFEMPKSSGYRFDMPPDTDLRATLDGSVWKIFMVKTQQTMPVATSLVSQPDFALGGRFLLPLPDAPTPVRMADPIVGDDLILVPLAQSEAFNIERRMADFTMLPAAQGLVIKPQTDKVVVRAVSDGVEITAEGGLMLSRSADTGLNQLMPGKKTSSAKFYFDLATWAGKPGETFTQTRQRLQQTIVDVPEAERNRARLELARFYFARGYGEEALSMLTLLAKQVPGLKAHSDFMALVGASEILAFRPQDGLRDLANPELADQPELNMWQAVGHALLREWTQAEEKFSNKETILTSYPEPFFSNFFVLAIESALAANEDREAADWLNFVSHSPHNKKIDPALAFLRGALEAKMGHASAAESAWKEAKTSNNRIYKVRSELSLIDLGVSTGSLTAAQAADRLEAMRFAWRGDDLEADILRRLGQFYIQTGNLKAGINAMSQAVTLYPNGALAPAIRAEMSNAFRDVFLGNLSKKFSPLDSLTLYQQYRPLMPSGKDGDAVMMNLAERLVAVDLLDQASSLLEELAKNRLQGDEKNSAILRLAAIRLLDHRPSDALAALDLMGSGPVPAATQNERVLLKARALSAMHREDEANVLLKDNASEGALLLRADNAMHSQKWADAAQILMQLVGAPPTETEGLSDDQSRALLNAAIAYALEDDQPSLDRLAIDYGPAMKNRPQYDTFALLTRPEKTGQLRDLSAAQAQISQVDMFQNFLNAYRSSGSSDASSAAKKP